jgi:exopolysaccharide biosynthesis polyprenyl glycosylphosphotransferase
MAGIPGTPGGPTIEWIEDLIRKDMVDRVIIAGFEAAVAETQHLLERLARISVDVTVIPNLEGLEDRVLNADHIGMLPAIDLSLRPLTAVQVALKRAEDLILASIILTLTAPVFLIVSIAIKFDSRGPILFRQPREGYHNQVFRVWKFRTMFNDASDPGSVRQTSRGDRRVTRVGRLLRRLSLDELPQIINVLRGEMSIVGPRPHPLSMTTEGLPMQQILDEYSARQRLKPGITGLAQVSGCRGEIDSREKLRRRVALDCHYIDNWSLFLDLTIILRTALLVIIDTDAY